MSGTPAILDTTEDTGLVLPQLLNAGLAANDRLKYYLTLLQGARTRAQQPNEPFSDLRGEREACGIAETEFDDVVAGSQPAPDGHIRIPGAQRIVQLLAGGLTEMLQPLQVAARLGVSANGRAEMYGSRLAALTSRLPSCAGDRMLSTEVDALTRIGDADHDSVHRLVMDLHRELNQLQAGVFRESVKGARTYGLTDVDRTLVGAFMDGVNDTAGLKFDHPGFGTTATRTGDRLSIQNDLGTTDGHIVVIHVRDLTATLTYTDIHPKRLRFFQDLLAPCEVAWEGAAEQPPSGAYVMAVGRITAGDRETLAQRLTLLGSRLVFVIDWNRARKTLRRFVKNTDAIAVLKWAADSNVGHLGFLRAGGPRLIYTALERAARAQVRYGSRLDEMLGRDAARALLKNVLRLTSEGLRANRSPQLMQDEIEAELLTHLATAEQSSIGFAAEHAMLVVTMAERVRHDLIRGASRQWPNDLRRSAELCAAWEGRANEIAGRANRVRDQRSTGVVLRALVPEADSAADALEEYAFLMTLPPAPPDAETLTMLMRLGAAVSRIAKEYVRALEHAQALPRQPVRGDVEEILVAADRVTRLTHESTAARRALQARLANDLKAGGPHILWDAAVCLARAGAALGRSTLMVRDFALMEVSAVHD